MTTRGWVRLHVNTLSYKHDLTKDSISWENSNVEVDLRGEGMLPYLPACPITL